MDRKTIVYGLVGLAAMALAVVSYYVYSGTGTSGVIATTTASLPVQLTADDHTIGDPKAPLTVIEYGAPSCPVCAHWNDTIFPKMKEKYIDTGKVYYVFRVFPLRSLDLAVAGMAHCLPREAYFNFIDMMWRNQPMWDPDGYDITDVHAALLHMGLIAGMSNQQVETCISDQPVLTSASAIGEKAQKDYGINSTPSFIVNGQLQAQMGSWQAVQDALDAALKAKAGK